MYLNKQNTYFPVNKLKHLAFKTILYIQRAIYCSICFCLSRGQAGHFMRIVSNGDNLNEVPDPVYHAGREGCHQCVVC